MVTSFAFTEPKIKALKPPSGDGRSARDWHKDTACAGLQVAVFPTGTKVYYFVKRIDGKPTRVKLGTTEELSVDRARKAAQKKAGQVADGKNPQADRRRRLHEPTLADLWESFLELHAKPRKKTWREDERKYKTYLVEFHKKRLSSITKASVAKWHGKLAQENGPVLANRSKALLATMFSKASTNVGYEGPNPCVGVANFPERSRERFLLPAEMNAFFTALAAEEPYWQAFFLLCLFTGSRRGNVASMEWTEIDLINAVWHIPATKTKNKRPASIALCEPALAILKTRYEQRPTSPYVFPAFKGEGHLVEPRKPWDRILAAAKIYDLHMHDLRRTQGSWQAAMGISLAIVGKSLGHADLKSTQVYARLQLDPVKDAVSRASGAMIDAAHVTIDGTGVKLLQEEGGADATTN